MKPTTQVDELELERLHRRLLHQQGNAFFCVTVSRALSHREIAESVRSYFSPEFVQVIDFKDMHDFQYSSAFLRFIINIDAKIVFLANFQLACADMSDAEFFQILNLSRDALAQIPVVLVFMMPLYFRIAIARNAPDFNSFFSYRADFTGSAHSHVVSMLDETTDYSNTKKELLNYYEDKFSALTDHKCKQAFETLLSILKLNTSVYSLSFVESKRFFELFCDLLPVYQDDYDIFPEDIARIFQVMGDYSNSLVWWKKTLEISERSLNFDDIDIATIYSNIAVLFFEKGDTRSALDWVEKALTITEEGHNESRLEVAALYNNIAGIYNNQGDYTKALEYYHKSLTLSKNLLGSDHPKVATTYSNISCVYSDQGDHSKSLEWLKKALVIRESFLGVDHPDTATTYHNIGVVYDCQEDYLKAFEWLQKALTIFEEKLGKEHPFTAAVYHNIAGVYFSTGEYSTALECYHRALTIREKMLGKEHRDTAYTSFMIALVEVQQQNA